MEEFLYAYRIISTRMAKHKMPVEFPDWFDPWADCGAVVPIFDFWNHNPEPSCNWSTEDGGMTIKAEKTVNPGEELFINYGYGF